MAARTLTSKLPCGGKERDPFSKAIGAATEQAEALRWQLEAAKMRFEAWRTTEASNRNIERMTK